MDSLDKFNEQYIDEKHKNLALVNSLRRNKDSVLNIIDHEIKLIDQLVEVDQNIRLKEKNLNALKSFKSYIQTDTLTEKTFRTGISYLNDTDWKIEKTRLENLHDQLVIYAKALEQFHDKHNLSNEEIIEKLSVYH